MHILAWPGRALPLLAAAAAACALAACGPGAGATSADQPTRTLQVSPVTSDGAPASGYHTTSQAAGASCEPGSEAIGQAYRCFAGNYVYDPCWAEKSATPTVLCVTDPWQHTDVRLTVSGGLSAIPYEGSAAGEPWGVQLSDGQRCLLAQGAHSLFDGRVIDYYCGQNLSLLRGLDTSAATWTAQSVAYKSGHMMRGPAERIEVAWYGAPDRIR
jgi:hypothetical protein